MLKIKRERSLIIIKTCRRRTSVKTIDHEDVRRGKNVILIKLVDDRGFTRIVWEEDKKPD